MNFVTLREEILKLNVEDRGRLMAEVGPELCRSMMPCCAGMMRDPEMQKVMRPMMEQMMQAMMGKGEKNA